MANPFYISLGFTLREIAAMSKLVGFFASIAGALIGGVVTVRYGILRSLIDLRRLAGPGESVFRLAGHGRPSHRLFRAMRLG